MPKFRASEKDWERLQEANKPYLKRFYNNLDILCVQRFKSRNKAIIALRASGYSAYGQSIKSYKVGIFTDSRLSNLQKWCLLFDVDMIEMFTRDFSKE